LLWASQITRGYSKRTWASFRQAEALGAHVRKGEKATPVIYYGLAKSREATNAPTDDNTPATFRFLKLFHVFNVEQLENVPDGFAIETAATPPPPAAIDAWAERAEARVRVGGASAYYAPSTDTIHMPPHEAFVSEEHRISTLCHELAHHTGAAHRLDRLQNYFTDRTARAKEEMIAEISAAQLGAMIGFKPDHLEDHAAYIADWAKLLRDQPRAFLSAAAKAQTAVDWLIERAGPPSAVQGESLRTDNFANQDLGPPSLNGELTPRRLAARPK
jgi:antirestriction protein ArdC